MRRRTLLKSSAAMLGITALGGYTFLRKSGLAYAGPADGFIDALPIPPILESELSPDGARSFVSAQKKGSARFSQDM